ncbi:MAG: Flp pilus assembly complex ATPase component TadA [Holosporaceae bacterium]|jgi:type II secretory ATPase GspE/PulE/Tfp pilus assembly ATPase PilB-like protein|nr:Flp pilus assembly complex ATPase component TadA [Holosporaceae bacterium]
MYTQHSSFVQNIGNIFLKKRLLTEKQIDAILEYQKTKNMLFGRLAVFLKFLQEDHLLEVLAELYTIDSVSLEFLYIDDQTLHLLDHETALSCMAVVFSADSESVNVALADPGDVKAIDKINARFKNLQIKFFVAKESEILRFIEIMKSSSDGVAKDPLLLLNKIIFDAIEAEASDIHFEPQESYVRVRARVDGLLRLVTRLSPEFWPRIKAKLKLMAKLDITDRYRPQSGHVKISLGGKSVDLRISTHLDKSEEGIVVRILDASSGLKSLKELGFTPEDFAWLKKISTFSSGIFLIAGPTGSGKTTTLYSLLKEIDSPQVNIMTLEDPIEYQIEGVKQMELREDGLLSFADGVRSILRQDPDVILIGEIRDEETAMTAIRASLTGRLVLATIHATNPTDGIRRLLNFNLKLSDILPSLIGVFSQRLVRYCNNSPESKVRGRFPLTEYLYFSEEEKKKILSTGDVSELKPDKSFAMSIEEALRNGLTTANEIERIIKNAYI